MRRGGLLRGHRAVLDSAWPGVRKRFSEANMIEGSARGSGAALRYGMVGGGQGAFIGDVHRKAIALDGSATLVAGCFSRSHENTVATGRGLGLSDERLYRSFEQMAEAEVRREDGI